MKKGNQYTKNGKLMYLRKIEKGAERAVEIFLNGRVADNLFRNLAPRVNAATLQPLGS